ncbi:hypothetical protein [Halovivax sp.]|uniref:hypothetical protein n=1 Tax=Halovivax sp. TaxID=1935978 RepID=UPI0025C70DA5|nr:hypothetical protein [Halovivax sp.]
MNPLAEWVASVREDRLGLLVDLAFAVAWVTMVEVVFRVVDGPTWAYYLAMLSGIVAYFGFVWNLEVATGGRDGD